MRSSTETLIAAAKELALYIESDDGVATSALREIAERLEELNKELETAKEQLGFLSWSNGRQTNG
jgi:hypothetical protein